MKKNGAGFEQHRTGAAPAQKGVLAGCCRESFAAWLIAWLIVRHGAPRWLGVAQLAGIVGCVET